LESVERINAFFGAGVPAPTVMRAVGRRSPLSRMTP
jgi:hypothetical protein